MCVSVSACLGLRVHGDDLQDLLQTNHMSYEGVWVCGWVSASESVLLEENTMPGESRSLMSLSRVTVCWVCVCGRVCGRGRECVSCGCARCAQICERARGKCMRMSKSQKMKTRDTQATATIEHEPGVKRKPKPSHRCSNLAI